MISDNKLKSSISEVKSTSLQQFDNNENLKLENVTPKLTKMWFRSLELEYLSFECYFGVYYLRL